MSTSPAASGNGPSAVKSRIDRRLVVYPALYVALGLLAWLCFQGGDKLRESVADGLVNIALFIVLGVLVSRGGERVLEHYMNIRFGQAPPPAPMPPTDQELNAKGGRP